VDQITQIDLADAYLKTYFSWEKCYADLMAIRGLYAAKIP